MKIPRCWGKLLLRSTHEPGLLNPGVGFLLVIVLMSGIRERLELIRVPKSLDGLPIAFISTALMALAFMGFAGMI